MKNCFLFLAIFCLATSVMAKESRLERRNRILAEKAEQYEHIEEKSAFESYMYDIIDEKLSVKKLESPKFVSIPQFKPSDIKPYEPMEFVLYSISIENKLVASNSYAVVIEKRNYDWFKPITIIK